MRVAPVVPVALVMLAACADQRENVAREHLRSQIGSNAIGALSLVSMNKTNGFEQEQMGMRLYTLEWEAQLKVLSDGWKIGWANFALVREKPTAFESAMQGGTSTFLFAGGNVVLRGKSTMQKADRGWRVLEMSVTGSNATASPEVMELVGTWKKVPVEGGQMLGDSLRIEILADGSFTVREQKPLYEFSEFRYVRYEQGILRGIFIFTGDSEHRSPFEIRRKDAKTIVYSEERGSESFTKQP